jgi:hypothetical protein
MSDVTIPDLPYTPFPKIARYSRGVIVSEKLDGSASMVYIDDTGTKIHAGSKNRWITPKEDNFGFARWVSENQEELLKLGPGSHWGEWIGRGVQRGYGLMEKRWYLFNTHKWNSQAERPKCCYVVPTLWEGLFDELDTNDIIHRLVANGSYAVPGWKDPEGIIIYHVASGTYLKKTVKDDHTAKSAK